MIPSYNKFVSRHTFYFGIGCCIAMTILTSSLARNSVMPDAGVMFFGLAAIAGSFAWATARENRAYWMYTICSLRMFEEKERLEALTHQKSNRVDDFLASPWGSLLTTVALVVLCCLTGHFALKPYLTYWLLFCGMIALPYWVYFIHNRASRSTIRTLLLHLAEIKKLSVKKKGPERQLVEDAFIMLIVNLSLVLPISAKPAFNLDQGSHSPAFIIAMIILMEIVTAFIFMVAYKSKRYIFCGALMLGSLSDRKNTGLKRAKFTRPVRVLFWLIVMPLWTTGICLAFSQSHSGAFTTLYLACLSLPLFIYLIEHGRILQIDHYEATHILNELKKLAPEI